MTGESATVGLGVIIRRAYMTDDLAFKVSSKLCRDQLRTVVGGDGFWETPAREERVQEVNDDQRGHRAGSGELWPF